MVFTYNCFKLAFYIFKGSKQREITVFYGLWYSEDPKALLQGGELRARASEEQGSACGTPGTAHAWVRGGSRTFAPWNVRS